MIDWLNSNSGAVQAIATGVLVVVTLAYVMLTAIQAKASGKMAKEMREQRLALDRPNLLVGFLKTVPPNHRYVAGQSTEEELARFPDELSFTVYNDGPGPAKMLAASCHDFLSEHRDYLLSKEPWACTLGGHGVPSTIQAMLGTDDDSQAIDQGLTSIIITYSDVHDRRWETHLKLSEMRDDTGSMEEPNEMCLYIESGEQHTVGPYSPEVQQ
jgi:hypothetical protein